MTQPMGARVLIVEDDVSVRRMMSEYLDDHGFHVRGVETGTEMRAEIERELPDLILLDIRLPGEDGLSLARYLRERYDVSIIMVTGSNDVVDRVLGLEMGADDYVPKPFDPRELLARVRSVLRRAEAAVAPVEETAVSPLALQEERVRTGRCWLEPMTRRLWDDQGGEVSITAMEFDLPRLFVTSPNRVLSRDQLLMHTRDREWDPVDRSIDIRIGRLRRKIEVDPSEPRSIRTVRSIGYMFVPD